MREITCLGPTDAGAAADQSTCEAELTVEFGCDRATSTAFAPCGQDLQLISCTTLLTGALPASCDTPLNIPPSDAQTKCVVLVDDICRFEDMCSGTTTTTASLKSCEGSIFADPQGVPCPLATAVSATYDQCVQDVKNAPCPSTADAGASDAGSSADAGMMSMGLPSCKGVITTVP